MQHPSNKNKVGIETRKAKIFVVLPPVLSRFQVIIFTYSSPLYCGLGFRIVVLAYSKTPNLAAISEDFLFHRSVTTVDQSATIIAYRGRKVVSISSRIVR